MKNVFSVFCMLFLISFVNGHPKSQTTTSIEQPAQTTNKPIQENNKQIPSENNNTKPNTLSQEIRLPEQTINIEKTNKSNEKQTNSQLEKSADNTRNEKQNAEINGLQNHKIELHHDEQLDEKNKNDQEDNIIISDKYLNCKVNAYKNGLSLVSQQRTLTLKQGLNIIRLQNISHMVMENSVQIIDKSGNVKLNHYCFYKKSRSKLDMFKKAKGCTIIFLNANKVEEKGVLQDVIEGDQVLIQLNNKKLCKSMNDCIGFENFNTQASDYLELHLDVKKAGQYDIEFCFLTSNFQWEISNHITVTNLQTVNIVSMAALENKSKLDFNIKNLNFEMYAPILDSSNVSYKLNNDLNNFISIQDLIVHGRSLLNIYLAHTENVPIKTEFFINVLNNFVNSYHNNYVDLQTYIAFIINKHNISNIKCTLDSAVITSVDKNDMQTLLGKYNALAISDDSQLAYPYTQTNDINASLRVISLQKNTKYTEKSLLIRIENTLNTNATVNLCMPLESDTVILKESVKSLLKNEHASWKFELKEHERIELFVTLKTGHPIIEKKNN